MIVGDVRRTGSAIRPNVRFFGQLSDEHLGKMYTSCRVAIMPIRYGAGIKGKVLEAMYFGIPFVATSIALEGIEGIEDVIDPFNDEISFAQEVIRLLNSGEAANLAIEKCKEVISRHYTRAQALSICNRVLGED
jgi:O-antigen biosynthesis protein